jgi:hypothetical protein
MWSLAEETKPRTNCSYVMKQQEWREGCGYVRLGSAPVMMTVMKSARRINMEWHTYVWRHTAHSCRPYPGDALRLVYTTLAQRRSFMLRTLLERSRVQISTRWPVSLTEVRQGKRWDNALNRSRLLSSTSFPVRISHHPTIRCHTTYAVGNASFNNSRTNEFFKRKLWTGY